jgi:DNA-binding LacI/PurR family transcriptional regulator
MLPPERTSSVCARGTSRGKATVKDVARAAGVSVTTVSRILNNPDLVVSEKQRLVQRALQTLDYIPNQLARSLISRRSKAIGLIVPTICGRADDLISPDWAPPPQPEPAG